ncbi:hypothetical protein [Bacteriophage sp.]|nr:hypothetical protein [Bacteriophage sp.]
MGRRCENCCIFRRFYVRINHAVIGSADGSINRRLSK